MDFVPLFDWTIRATLLLLVALPVVRLLERRSATAAHRLLTVVFLCIVVVLPALMTAASGWRWKTPLWVGASTATPPSDAMRSARPTAPAASRHDVVTLQGFPAPRVVGRLQGDQPQGGIRRAVPRASEPPAATAPDRVPVASSEGANVDRERSPQLTSSRRAREPRQFVTLAWFMIAGLLAVRVGRSVNRLRGIVSSCKPATLGVSRQVHNLSQQWRLKRPIQVLHSEPGSMPMACWLGRWVIVVPEDIESWPEGLQEVTLLHELGHIARRDAWFDYVTQCVACVMWPNPLVWLAAADARRLRERACDEWSLSRYGGDAKRYALSLVEIVRRCQQQEFPIACAMANHRGLESRLKWLFSCPTSRKRWHFVSLPTGLAAFCLAVAVATAEPTDATRRDGKRGSTPESRSVTLSQEPAPRLPVLSVSGTVRDASGHPLEGASVVLRANMGGVQYAPGLQHARDVLAQTKADAQGRYAFSGVRLPPRLVDAIDDLRQGKPGVQVLAWAKRAGLQWKPISSFDEAAVDFRLQEEADVSGRALDESGTPLSDGALTVVGFTKATDALDAFFKDPGDLNTIRSEVVFAGAVRDGRFRLANMPQNYRLSVRLESQSGHRAFFVIDTGSGAFKEVTYRNGGQESVPVHRTPIRITAKQQPWVRIRVVDSQGKPVSGGGVEAVDAERHYGGSAAIDGDGVALLTVNNPGVHDVYYGSDPLNPTVGVVQEINIQPSGGNAVEMKLPASRKLTGRVVDSDSGDPVPGVYVFGSNTVQGDAGPRATSSMAVSGADGRFELPVTEGLYNLSIRHEVDGYFVPTYAARRNAGPEPDYPRVAVTDEGPLDEVVLRVARGLVVKGVVVDERGVPAHGVRVVANCEGPPYRQATTITDGDGSYQFLGLSPYVPVRIAAWSESGVAEEIIAPTEDHPWDQTLTKTVALKLVPGSSVVGRVTRAGRPAPGISVRLRRAGPPEPGERGVRFLLVGETTTDEQGRYRLIGLRKGDRYYLEVETQGDAEVRDWRYAMPYSHTVEVDDGATIELPDAELKTNGQTLAGVVVDPAGNPVEGVTVSARLASGMHLSRPQDGPPPWTDTDGKGYFKLTHLPDEPIVLMAYKRNPAGGRILYPSHVSPEMNADDIRIVLDPSLLEEPEDLD